MYCPYCDSNNWRENGYRYSRTTGKKISKKYKCCGCEREWSVPFEEKDEENKKRIAERCGSEKDLIEQLHTLKEDNRRLKETVDVFSKRRREYVIDTKWNNSVVFGVAGDTQFGSLYERSDALLQFYKLCHEEGINIVLNAGDVVDGHKMYRGHEFELYALGFDAQANAFYERAPRVGNIQTHFICGNHDASFKKQSGIDVGKELERRRKDWHFCGWDYADVVLRTKSGYPHRVRMVHPSGGTAYAISYKSQKMAEAISGGQKPQTLLLGHYHKADHLPCERNIQTIQCGAFQSQTPYMQRKPTPAHVGGWIVKATVNKDGLTSRFQTEFVAFYEPKDM